MAEEGTDRTRLGKFLAGVGVVWGLLFFVANFFDFGGTPLGDILGFFGDSLFFPIVLIFSGRAMARRGKRGSLDEVLRTLGSRPQESNSKTTPPILPGQTTRSPQSTQRSAPTSGPAPAPKRRPAPKPAPVEPDLDELAASIGFDEVKDLPRKQSGAKPADFKPKTSEEMIAEARKKYNKDG